MANVLPTFARIAYSSREQQVFREQFNAFIMKKGMFVLPPIQLDAFTMVGKLRLSNSTFSRGCKKKF
jgi:hypothetical protein